MPIDPDFVPADRVGDVLARSGVTMVDCEASGLEPGSWPIEVGIARVENGEVHAEGRLICPEPEWSMEHWSPASAEVHGIPLQQLHDEGHPADEVAAWLAKELRGAGVSDAPEYECRWLTRLWELLDPRPPLVLLDFDVLVAATIPSLDLVRAVYRHLDMAPAPHRAAGDAAPPGERLARRGWALPGRSRGRTECVLQRAGSNTSFGRERSETVARRLRKRELCGNLGDAS